MGTTKTIKNNQLTPGTFYYVMGKIGYSRIGRQTNQSELDKYNKGKTWTQNTPITQLTIYDAQVVYADANNPTIEEQFAEECLYTSSKKEYTGQCFSPINKTKNLPLVKVKNPNDEKRFDDYDLQGRELAQGVEVVVGMRVFEGKGNKGVSLDHVIVTGDLKLRAPGNGGAAQKSALERFGITFSNEPSPFQDADVETVADTIEDDGDDAGAPAETANPFVANNAASAATPAEKSAPAPSNNPFTAKRQYT